MYTFHITQEHSESAELPKPNCGKGPIFSVEMHWVYLYIQNLHSPNKHGRQQTISNTNEIRQL